MVAGREVAERMVAGKVLVERMVDVKVVAGRVVAGRLVVGKEVDGKEAVEMKIMEEKESQLLSLSQTHSRHSFASEPYTTAKESSRWQKRRKTFNLSEFEDKELLLATAMCCHCFST